MGSYTVNNVTVQTSYGIGTPPVLYPTDYVSTGWNSTFAGPSAQTDFTLTNGTWLSVNAGLIPYYVEQTSLTQNLVLTPTASLTIDNLSYYGLQVVIGYNLTEVSNATSPVTVDFTINLANTNDSLFYTTTLTPSGTIPPKSGTSNNTIDLKAQTNDYAVMEADWNTVVTGSATDTVSNITISMPNNTVQLYVLDVQLMNVQ